MSEPAAHGGRIFVVAPGDPRSKRTWSGTPSAIGDVLEQRGLYGGGRSSGDLNRTFAKAIAHGLSRLWYYPATLTGYGRWVRRLKGAAVARAIDASGCDAVLHMMTTHLPLPAGRRRSRQYLYLDTSQRLWERYFGGRDQRRGRLERDVQRLEREAFAGMDHVFTISHYLREDLIAHYGLDPAKVTAIGSGRGKIEPFHGAKDYTVPRILYVALNWDEKGGQLTLDAFRLAKATRPDLTMTMVCEATRAQALQDDPVDGVTALTAISWEHLQSLYDEATLFVMPAGHQPWGLAYLEAMACRAPIIGLDRLSTPELTGYGAFGWTVKTEDPHDLAATIVEAHADPVRLAEMGKRAQAYCLENFGWDLVVDRIVRQLEHDSGPLASA